MRAKVAKRLRRLVTAFYDADPRDKWLTAKGTTISYNAGHRLIRSVQATNHKSSGRAIYQKLKKTYKSGVIF